MRGVGVQLFFERAFGQQLGTVNEPRERRVLAVSHPCPRHYAAVFRPRERHIQKTQFIRPRFDPFVGNSVFRGIQIQDGRSAVRLVILRSFRRLRFRATVPGERAENDWKLQPLAAVDRDDFHQVLIAFQAKLRAFVAGFRARRGAGEPFDEPLRRQPCVGLGLLHQLGQMQDVGQAARAVGIFEQVGGAIRIFGEEQPSNEGRDAPFAPCLAPVLRPCWSSGPRCRRRPGAAARSDMARPNRSVASAPRNRDAKMYSAGSVANARRRCFSWLASGDSNTLSMPISTL